MKDFKERRVFHALLSSWWLFFVLIIISAWLVGGAREAYLRMRVARAERERLEAQVLLLSERRVELERKLEGFSQGEGIEEEARQQLFLKRPEEEVVIIIE